jgi:hypothetical protein
MVYNNMKEPQYTNGWKMESYNIYWYMLILDKQGELHFSKLQKSINKSNSIQIEV